MERRYFHRLGLLGLVAWLAACHDGPTTALEVGSDPGPLARPSASNHPFGYTTRGPLGTGFAVNRYGSPVEVTYEVHDGLAIWEGDIIIGRAGEVPTSAGELAQRLASRPNAGPGSAIGVDPVRPGTGPDLPPVARGSVIDGDPFRWPNGVVPYEIDDNLINNVESRINDAIAAVHRETAGVKLVPRQGQADYVRFTSGSGCSSFVGMQSGEQEIRLINSATTGCVGAVIAHEILHALGMWHEQSRCDRNQFVEIHWENIEEGREHNFEQRCGSDVGFDIDEYAFRSRMHYGATAFSSTGEPTITAKDAGVDESEFGDSSWSDLGAGRILWFTDVITINTLYGAFNNPPIAVINELNDSYPEGSPIPFRFTDSWDWDPDELRGFWRFGDGVCESDPTTTGCGWRRRLANPVEWTYADDGQYTLQLTVRDGPEGLDGFLEDQTSAVVNVHNVAPTVTITPPSAPATSGEPFLLEASFTDPGVEDAPWLAEWDFGDGNTFEEVRNAQGTSNKFEAANPFCAAGTYTVMLGVTDKDGDTGLSEMEVTVIHAGGVQAALVPAGPIRSRRRGALPVAVLGSEDFDVTEIDPATLTLGDGDGDEAPAGQPQDGLVRDVNADGHPDLVVNFDIGQVIENGDLDETTTQLMVQGFLADGCLNFQAELPIHLVP